MANDVDLEVKKSGVCKYYDSLDDVNNNDPKYGIKKRFDFDRRFLPCQESVIAAYFAYKYLVSESTRIYFKDIPYKTKNSGLKVYDKQKIPIDFKNFRHQFGLPTFKVKGNDTTETDFENDIKIIIKDPNQVPTTLTCPNPISEDDKNILNDLNTVMQMATASNGQFNITTAIAYRNAIERALESDNVFVKKTLYVTLRHLEKAHRYETDNNSYIHSVKKLNAIDDQMKRDDFIKWIDGLTPYEKAIVYSTNFKGNKLNPEQKHMLSIITAHMDKYSQVPYVDIFNEAKEEYKRLCAVRQLERDTQNTKLTKITELVSDRYFLRSTTVEKIPKSDVEKVRDEYYNDAIDLNNYDEVNEFIKRCYMTLNTLQDGSDEELKADIEGIIEEYRETCIKKMRDDIKDRTISAFSNGAYVAKKLGSEMNRFTEELKNGLSRDNISLRKYLNQCSLDSEGKKISGPTDHLVSIRERLKQGPTNSFIDFMLEGVDSKIKKDATYEGTAFDRLSRIEAEILKEIILYDIQNQASLDFDSTQIIDAYEYDVNNKTVIRSSNGGPESYDTVDICFLMFTHEAIISALETKYKETGKRNLNYERIRCKSELLSAIGTIKEKQMPMRLTTDEIVFTPQSANQLHQDLIKIRENLANEFDPLNPPLDQYGKKLTADDQVKDVAIKHNKNPDDYGASDHYLMLINTGFQNIAVYMTYHYDRNGDLFLSPTHIISGVQMDKDKRIIISQDFKSFFERGKAFTSNDKGDVTIKSSEPVIIQRAK